MRSIASIVLPIIAAASFSGLMFTATVLGTHLLFRLAALGAHHRSPRSGRPHGGAAGLPFLSAATAAA